MVSKKKKTKTKKKKKKKLKKRKFTYILASLGFITVLALAYVLCSPLAIAGRMIFHPERPKDYSKKSIKELKSANVYPSIPAEVLGAKREDVLIPVSNGETLHGIYFNKPGSKYTFILHHGQGGNVSKHMGLVKTVLLNGQSVLTYDYEGYGISSGEPSISGLIEDGRAAFDFLVRKKSVNPRSIVQYGASLGTGVASNTALTKGARAAVLIAPYTALKKLAIERLPYLSIYPDVFFPKPDIGSRQFFIFNRSSPILMIHGDKDHTIDISHSKKLKDIARKRAKLVVIPGKHHGDFSTEELAKEIGLFIDEYLESSNTKVKPDEHKDDQVIQNNLKKPITKFLLKPEKTAPQKAE